MKQDEFDPNDLGEDEELDWEKLKEAIEENVINPDATIEYLFVEKAETQIEPINDDQGYIMGFINIFYTGSFKNDDIESFRLLLSDELNLSVQDSNYFKNTSVNLADYKFALVDNDKNVIEFDLLNERFFEALIASLRNLLIAGKNFDFEAFKHTEIFDEWFDEYTNRF